LLLSAEATNPATDAQLRRAVSTGYYALFHKVLQAAGQRFMGGGSERSAGYRLLYRGYSHGRMKEVCKSLDAPTMKESVRRQLGRTAVSQEMRVFAGAFSDLQEARHLADYDPSTLFLPSDSTAWVDLAEAAMAAFDLVAPDEKADVLALMLVNPRG
jgi:hypothetical protein